MARLPQKDDGYIRFACPQCGKRLKIRDIYEGGAVIPCPGCRGDNPLKRTAEPYPFVPLAGPARRRFQQRVDLGDLLGDVFTP